jgi:uncharacterized membrane protein YphA (DoxX/SURF4 family)
MNWTGTQKSEGFEHHLLAFAITAFLLIRGAGEFSVDHDGFDGAATRAGSLMSGKVEMDAPRL